jgi:hypothetical protein
MAAFSLRSRKIDLEKIGAIPVIWGELPTDELEMTRDLPELGTGMDLQEEQVRPISTISSDVLRNSTLASLGVYFSILLQVYIM